MRFRGWGLAFLLLGGVSNVWADEPQTGDSPPPAAQSKATQSRPEQPKKEQPRTKTTARKAEPLQIPYRLTNSQHILVRVKINGKGPFNFIVDTGAPIMILNTDVGKKLGLEPGKNKFARIDRVEIEGGAVLEKFPCLIETPFQLEGMNGMGLAGRELHGILGYTVLARYRMEIDFTRDKMTWTPLDYTPPEPRRIGGGGGGGQGGLEALGKFMKLMGFLAGARTPETVLRGFAGIELNSDKEAVSIASVLGKSPAAAAGLKTGDKIVEIGGKSVRTLDDVRRLTADTAAGTSLPFLIRRDGKTMTIRLKMGDGL